jgi:hypothetical protein
MAIIVEDGTGKADAVSYLSVEECDAYHNARGHSAWAAAESSEKEAALVKATQYLDGHYGRRWRGSPMTSTQALEWPRFGATDRYGRLRDGVPREITQAVAEAALRALSGDLAPDRERGGQVVRETVGPISTEYALGAPAGTTYPVIDGLLSGLVTSGANVRITR